MPPPPQSKLIISLQAAFSYLNCLKPSKALWQACPEVSPPSLLSSPKNEAVPNKKGFVWVMLPRQQLCSTAASLLPGSSGCTAPVPCPTGSNLPGANPSYPLNETGDGRCLRSCEDVWIVMASCNRANTNFATTVFSCALSTQLKYDFFLKFLQKQTEKEGGSLSAWGITTHTHR